MLKLRGYLEKNRAVIKGEPPHTVLVNNEPLDHRESCKIRNHSPTGFSWGYGGSGPAQLALAILLLFISEKEALSLYQAFKWEMIARIPMDSEWEMRGADVLNWVIAKREEAVHA